MGNYRSLAHNMGVASHSPPLALLQLAVQPFWLVFVRVSKFLETVCFGCFGCFGMEEGRGEEEGRGGREGGGGRGRDDREEEEMIGRRKGGEGRGRDDREEEGRGGKRKR